MRWDIRVNWYWWLAAACLAVWTVTAPEYLQQYLSDAKRGLVFWASLGGVVIFASVGFISAIRGESSAPSQGHIRRMIVPYGMGICALAFVIFSAVYFWPQHKTQSSSPSKLAIVPIPPPSTPQQPPPDLLLSLFMTDHNHMTGAFTEPSASEISEHGSFLGKLFFRIGYDSDSRSKFILIYIPANESTAKIAYDLPSVIPVYLESDATNNVLHNFQIQAQGSSNAERFTDYPFSGRVYIYNETPIGAEDIGEATKAFRNAGMNVELMGRDAAMGVRANIQLGYVRPLPNFEIDDNRICIKGPLAAPLPIPVRLCTQGKTSPQTSP